MHKYTDSISLYGLNFEINKVSKIFPYNPSDIATLPQNYKLDGKKIYSSNLSPGVVYSGYDKILESKVAIKELRKGKLNEEYQHEMAKNELAIHFSLSSISNNIVKVRDYFEDENAYYLIMEYSEEPDFFEDLLENRYCPVSDERTLKAFAFDILTGLKEIHKNNIIHCDIKPQNFLLFKNENSENNENDSIDEEYFDDYFLKITDFGYAHVIPNDSDKAYMKLPCGTFAYTAPEVTKVKLLKFIIIILELLCGQVN
jgi:serine/threonine-protein kinase Chk2